MPRRELSKYLPRTPPAKSYSALIPRVRRLEGGFFISYRPGYILYFRAAYVLVKLLRVFFPAGFPLTCRSVHSAPGS